MVINIQFAYLLFVQNLRFCLSCLRKRIVELIDQLDTFTIEWSEFEEKIRKSHANRLGGPYERKLGAGPKIEEYFYSNPQPGCLCSNNTRKGEAKSSEKGNQ